MAPALPRIERAPVDEHLGRPRQHKQVIPEMKETLRSGIQERDLRDCTGTNAAIGGYSFAAVRAIAQRVKPLTTRGLYSRSPGGSQSNFGYESLMDETVSSLVRPRAVAEPGEFGAAGCG